MSWNPVPIYGNAQWNGNQILATRKQLLSTSAGLYDDLKDFNFSTISVSTLNVPQWISTAALYVSDIKGFQIDISGVTINQNGLLNAPIVSLSSMVMKGFDSLLDVDVSFDFGLGQAIGGVVGGLGALVGGATIAVGTGAGLAIQGAEQGIATMVAGRPQNFISQTNYETINFTSQLQISTLGTAYPYFSSIFRTVDSVAPNQIPGPEIFTSTIFFPGQICIRSVSDPFNLISGDSNMNTSTIQSFGQWVPLTGLEPENIEAYSVSTINLQATNTITSNITVTQAANLNYNSPLNIDLGSSGDAKIFGFINQFNFQSDQPIVFNQIVNPGTVAPSAQLTLGNGYESIFNVSSIYSVGEMKTVNFYASTITAETLNVVSTLFLTSTNIEITTSTQTVNADYIYGKYVTIENLVSSLSFATPLGNPVGSFDINKNDYIVSSTYASVSSLTQNILNYQLYEKINEQTSFSPFNAQAEIYTASPANVGQWESTMMICNPGADIGGALYFTYPSSFFTVGLTGSFDLTVDMRTVPFSFGAAQYVGQVPGEGYNEIIPYITPTTGFYQTYHLTCDTNGIWSYTSPAPPPPITVNSNVFQIYQDINDTYITATDRLHLQAGDILFDGTLNLANVNLDTLNVNFLNVSKLANVAAFSTISTITGQPTAQISQYFTSNYVVPSMLSSFQTTLSTNLLHSVYTPELIRPTLYLSPGTNNDMTLSKLGTWAYNGVFNSQNYALGTFYITPPDNTFKIYTDNNGFGLASNLQVVNLINQSPTSFMSLYINFPSAAINIPASSGISIFWNNSTGLFTSGTYTAWPPINATSYVDLLQSYNTFTVVSPSTIMTSNVSIGGTLSLTGKTITTWNMTWNHEITFGSQHGYGAVNVQDGNGNSYNSSQWRMVFSPHLVELNNNAYAMNSWEVSPAVDGNGNWIINFSVYYTTTMANNFNIYFWAGITMYPVEMIDVMPTKNWGTV